VAFAGSVAVDQTQTMTHTMDGFIIKLGNPRALPAAVESPGIVATGLSLLRSLTPAPPPGERWHSAVIARLSYSPRFCSFWRRTRVSVSLPITEETGDAAPSWGEGVRGNRTLVAVWLLRRTGPDDQLKCHMALSPSFQVSGFA
jgi:hypothetical protein